MKLISGFLGGRILKTIESKGYRPAMGKVREALFSMLESHGVNWKHTHVLDVYAGTGSLAFEAISRNAPSACFIELDKNAVDCLYHNIENLDIVDNCDVIKQDAGKYLAREAHTSYELIFVDPPYGEKMFLPTLQNIIINNWLAQDGILVAEVEAGLKFPAEQENLTLLKDRTYGQTRILLWQKS